MAPGATFNKHKTPMVYNNLGATGIQVSQLSFGCMSFSDEKGHRNGEVQVADALAMMRECYEHGINFFDNAEVYGGAGGKSELIMGKAFHMGVDQGLWERKDLVISTKIYFGSRGLPSAKDNPNTLGLSRKHLFEGLRESLNRMQLEYVDLVFCHRPDPRVPIEDIVRSMNILISRGMAFHWGTSEWSAQMLERARAIADRLGLEPPMFDQCEYSLIHRQKVERDFEPLYSCGLGLTIFSPLAGGALTGKYAAGGAAAKGRHASIPQMKQSASPFARAVAKKGEAMLQASERCVTALRPVAAELGCSVAQLSVAWATKHHGVSTVIIGATRLEQLRENLAAMAVAQRLTPEIMARIDAACGTAPPADPIALQTRGLRGPPAKL